MTAERVSKPALQERTARQPGAFTAAHLVAALQSALAELRRSCDEVNALNVFPVADHDTGSNLCATLASAADAVREVEGKDLGTVAEAAARGAFFGARGNSGAILAEYLYGLSQAWSGLEQADAQRTAAALNRAARTARAAVHNPVEGTILTVADAAAAAGGRGAVLLEVLDLAAAAARAAWSRTRRLLPALRRAGVVDAGAAGVVALLEAMAAAVRGVPAPPLSPPARGAVAAVWAGPVPLAARYCTEVVVRAHRLPGTRARRALERLGDSVVVAERDGLVRVHVHTETPHLVLLRAARWGEVQEIRALRLSPDRVEEPEPVRAPAGTRPPARPGRCSRPLQG
ncbi:MAG: DAK2 domain-containing protein [Armatimonadota bacterium]|nr:DAK2 domain-containing protein [Armatimonadota bacterium]